MELRGRRSRRGGGKGGRPESGGGGPGEISVAGPEDGMAGEGGRPEGGKQQGVATGAEVGGGADEIVHARHGGGDRRSGAWLCRLGTTGSTDR